MLLANLLITPYYMGVSMADVRALIPTLLLPLNFIKAVLNVGLVLLLYKHIGTALRKAGFLPRKVALSGEGASLEGQGGASRSTSALWRTLVVSAAAVLLVVASILVIFLVLGGHIGFGV